jgi:hypothetical protein
MEDCVDIVVVLAGTRMSESFYVMSSTVGYVSIDVACWEWPRARTEHTATALDHKIGGYPMEDCVDIVVVLAVLEEIFAGERSGPE